MLPSSTVFRQIEGPVTSTHSKHTNKARSHVPLNIRFCDKIKFNLLNSTVWSGYQGKLDLVSDNAGKTFVVKNIHDEISWDSYYNEVNTLWDLKGARWSMQIVCEYTNRKAYVSEFYGYEPFHMNDSNWKKILYNIVLAIEEVRSRGYAHRDIHPGNIKVLPNDEVVLLDFGMSLPLTSKTLSKTGWYPAPEMSDPHIPSDKIDIYQLGMMFYAMAIGFKLNTPVNVQPIKFNEADKLYFEELLGSMSIRSYWRRIDIKEIKKHPLFEDLKDADH